MCNNKGCINTTHKNEDQLKCPSDVMETIKCPSDVMETTNKIIGDSNEIVEKISNTQCQINQV